MVIPALLYLAVTSGGGWGGRSRWQPTSRSRWSFSRSSRARECPKALKLFLLTLTIVDDIGAIVVITVFYSKGIAFAWLLAALATIAVILCMQRSGLGQPFLYVVPAVVLWVCTLESGVHATIAGVVLGLLTPARPFGGHEVIENLEQRLHPWSTFLVIPIFALANAGLNLKPTAMEPRAHEHNRLGNHCRARGREAPRDHARHRVRCPSRTGAPSRRPLVATRDRCRLRRRVTAGGRAPANARLCR